MNNETTRIDKVLRILEELLDEPMEREQNYLASRLREVLLHVEVMKENSIYRTLVRKHHLLNKQYYGLKNRLETHGDKKEWDDYVKSWHSYEDDKDDVYSS